MHTIHINISLVSSLVILNTVRITTTIQINVRRGTMDKLYVWSTKVTKIAVITKYFAIELYPIIIRLLSYQTHMFYDYILTLIAFLFCKGDSHSVVMLLMVLIFFMIVCHICVIYFHSIYTWSITASTCDTIAQYIVLFSTYSIILLHVHSMPEHKYSYI